MRLSRDAKTLVVLMAGVVVLTAVPVLIGVGRDDEATDAEWCAALDEVFTALIPLDADEPTLDEPEELIPLERAADAIQEMTAPEEIRNDLAVISSAGRSEGPRGDQRPYIRAQVAVFDWVFDNCALSDKARAELRADHEENVEFLDGD